MRHHERIGRARNARINQAISHAEQLIAVLRMLQGHAKDQHVDDKDAWFDARTELESLTQCVHEANAYSNAVAPRGGETTEIKPTIKTFSDRTHGVGTLGLPIE